MEILNLRNQIQDYEKMIYKLKHCYEGDSI